MYALTELSRNTQRAICMLTAVVIVTASLSLGALGIQSMEKSYSPVAQHTGYTVTVAALQ